MAARRYVPFCKALETLHCRPPAGNLTRDFSGTSDQMGGTGLEPVTSTVKALLTQNPRENTLRPVVGYLLGYLLRDFEDV